MRLAVSSALLLVAGAASAAEQVFLFDTLRLRPYHASWEKLVKDVQPTPDWLMQFNRNYDGASGEVTEIEVEGKKYQISYVCKPTDCKGHRFEVIFDEGGEHAYGALGGKDFPPEFYGKPGPDLQAALAKALQG
jgi:hypothetical protein